MKKKQYNNPNQMSLGIDFDIPKVVEVPKYEYKESNSTIDKINDALKAFECYGDTRIKMADYIQLLKLKMQMEQEQTNDEDVVIEVMKKMVSKKKDKHNEDEFDNEDVIINNV